VFLEREYLTPQRNLNILWPEIFSRVAGKAKYIKVEFEVLTVM
jgi:hypothetical protein